MPKHKNDELWKDAKKRCRLNDETIRMAKELGLNPKSLIKNIPNKSEPWKAPVHEWIKEMYIDRQEKSRLKTQKKENQQNQ